MPRLALPFLDSVGETDEHGPEKGSLVRPWKAYWPPEAGSELHAMLEQNVPEVLTWRFNPKDPFDRPWQSWTKSAILSGKVCTSTVLQPAVNGVVYETPTAQEERAASEEARQRNSKLLDAQITSLHLPHTTPKQFNYLSGDPLYLTTKPYHTRLPFMGKIRRSNIIAQGYSGVNIYDLRNHEKEFTLDRSGFQYCHIPVPIAQWTNETAKNQYLPLMETWLKEFFGATRVHIFTYTFRCENRDRTSTESWVGPYMRAHCDVTLNSGIRRLNLHLPEEAEKIMKGRWRMVGLWRALTGPYQDRPLALLDHRSLAAHDLLGADVVFPHYCDEGYEVRYSPLHRWFYKSRMTPDEALLFKLYDSSPEEVRFCPHGAFVDPSVPEGTPQRASVELRAIIIG